MNDIQKSPWRQFAEHYNNERFPSDSPLNDRTALALDLYSSFLTDYEAYNDRRFAELAELSFQAADAFIAEAKKQITRK